MKTFDFRFLKWFLICEKNCFIWNLLYSTYTFIQNFRRDKFFCKIVFEFSIIFWNLRNIFFYRRRLIKINSIPSPPLILLATPIFAEQTDFTSSINKINAELHLRAPNFRHQFFSFSPSPLASSSSNAMNYSHTCSRKENFFLFPLSLTQTYTHSLSLSLSIFQKKSATLKVPP